MTIEDGRPVQTREIQRLFSSRGLPRSLSRATFLALASFLVVAAVLFPAQQLDLGAQQILMHGVTSCLCFPRIAALLSTPIPRARRYAVSDQQERNFPVLLLGRSSAGHPCRNPFKVRVEERASHKSGAGGILNTPTGCW